MEEFARWEMMIGKENLDKLKNSSVMIVGLGGVGGYALETLVRSGVGRVILVDFDTVDLSNINRQIIALHSTVGSKKVDAWKKRVLDINPHCKVVLKDLFYSDDTKEEVWCEKIDFVIDCCDTVSSKKSIIKECLVKKIPFLSCMGTGRKMDPALLKIVELSKTSVDPLARILRKWKREEGIRDKIMVLSSSEVPFEKEEEVIPSNCFVPNVAGILMARYAICSLLQKSNFEDYFFV